MKENIKKLVATFFIEFDGIDIPIKIYVFEAITNNDDVHSKNYTYESSHFIYTPVQADPYTFYDQEAETIEEALSEAKERLYLYYNIAVGKGHSPDNTWLSPNEYL